MTKKRRLKYNWYALKGITASGIGRILYFLGFAFKTSTGICGSTTRGFGNLDANGYWQFPIYVKNPTNTIKDRYRA